MIQSEVLECVPCRSVWFSRKCLNVFRVGLYDSVGSA